MSAIEKPRSRINGCDSYMVQKTAVNILKELEEAGWSVGEAEMLPRELEIELRKNQKRKRDGEPFLVVEAKWP